MGKPQKQSRYRLRSGNIDKRGEKKARASVNGRMRIKKEAGDQQEEKVKIKKEMGDYEKLNKETDRKYGDRMLLARQPKTNGKQDKDKGMLKLGGGNCTMDMFPKKHDQRRFDAIGDTVAIAYSDSWQRDGPKYAGQRFASVDYLPRDANGSIDPRPFSVFMKRTIKNAAVTLGWEYCGEYEPTDPEEEMEVYRSAHNIEPHHKAKMKKQTLASHAWGKSSIARWRRTLTLVLEKDNSPAEMAPLWMRERRAPTMAELDQDRDEKQAPLAARARALGFKLEGGNSDKEIVDIMFELDEKHQCKPIQFVRYNEKLYGFVKDGPTALNKFGKKRKPGEQCALASDWYNVHDQKVGL